MATKRWEGDAPAIKQKDVRTAAGTPAAGNTITVTGLTGAVYTYTLTASDTTAALTAANFVTDFNDNASGVSSEFSDVIASASGADVTFTANTAGKPFTFSYGVTGGGVTFDAGSGSVSNSGPEVYDVAANWGGANPSGSDDLVFDQGDTGPKYRVDQLASLSGTLTINSTFLGDIGLGPTDDGGYVQPRARYLKNDFTVINLGSGDGDGAGRVYLWCSATNLKVNVWKTGGGSDSDLEAVQIKGDSGTTFDVFTVVEGEVGCAIYGGDVATITALQIGSANTSPRFRGGIGCVVTNLNVVSGTVLLESSPSGTVTILNGTVTFSRGGAITALTVDGGTLYLGGVGTGFTITDCSIGEGAVYDLSQGDGAVTHTNPIYVDKGGSIIDPRDRLATNTNIIPRGCTWSEITVVTGIGRTWRKVA